MHIFTSGGFNGSYLEIYDTVDLLFSGPAGTRTLIVRGKRARAAD